MTAERWGSLAEVTFPALVRPLVRGKETGVLRCTRGKVVKTVYVSLGRLIFATSTDPDDRLGERLLARGLITYHDLEESVRAIQAGRRQGTVLVERGAIRLDDLVAGVTEQVQEILYTLFRWEDGDYEFSGGDLPSREVAVLRMSTADILMEGIRRIQAWSRIQAGVGGLGQRYALAKGSTAIVSGMSLQSHEVNLIATLDGTPRLDEICAASRLSDFVICRTVWGLWAAGVLDRFPQDAEDRLEPSREETVPHEDTRGASVLRELERFQELHRLMYDLVRYELRDKAADFFRGAFARITQEHPALFADVAIEPDGAIDLVQLQHNVVTGEIATYLRGLDRLLEIEERMARDALGERKAAIIQDGLMELKEQQLLGSGGRPRRN
jgi:hypothetical protein